MRYLLAALIGVLLLGGACTAPSASTPNSAAAPAEPSATTAPGAQAEPSPTAFPITRREAIEPLTADTPAPDFQLILFDGKPLHLSELRGKLVVLNFWASWCPPCRQEMPAFQRAWEKHRDHGVVFVGIAISDQREKAEAFAQQVGVTYPLGMDETGQVAASYRLRALPSTLFINQDGTIAKQVVGAMTEGSLNVFIDLFLRR
ncbi:MAG: TlpA family protein disulfide reductase [Chloroflexi bacterium]|nr:TlpA family protein disulfide reductase [Chloroflexota bacterium]